MQRSLAAAAHARGRLGQRGRNRTVHFSVSSLRVDIHKVSHGRGDVTHGEKIEAAELDLDTKITEMSCLSQ